MSVSIGACIGHFFRRQAIVWLACAGTAIATSAGVVLVPPADPPTDGIEIEVSHADDEQRDAEVKQGGPIPRRISADQHRAFDLIGVSSDLRTMSVEDLGLADEVVAVGERVPDVGVLCDESQRSSFT